MDDFENEPALVRSVMSEYGRRTGLMDRGGAPKRYLWTDAFAVCNFLELHRSSPDLRFFELASQLIDQVHSTLGRFAEGDDREGWISGLSDTEARLHPTRGGLRIGKRMLERGESQPFDERLEWERDGQYFHYLARWMHALDCFARFSGDGRYNLWALELAKTAYRGFVYADPTTGTRRMVWKMSVDLSRPQIPSMGHHDPLDGLVTFMALQASAETFGEVPTDCDLTEEISDLRNLCSGKDWATDDALGIGGLLVDACRVSQLVAGPLPGEADRLADLLESAEVSLKFLFATKPFARDANSRLAFRELGLSIGLRGLDLIQSTSCAFLPPNHPAVQSTARLARYAEIGRALEQFWLQPEHRRGPAWREHVDINSVMLATSLAPRTYLDICSRN
jgi:hypothetical protein